MDHRSSSARDGERRNYQPLKGNTMKFKYAGEYNGRTERGEIDADSKEEAMRKLAANGIKVQRLTSDGGQGGLAPEAVGPRLVPTKSWWQFWK
jgi:hypothetical protein